MSYRALERVYVRMLFDPRFVERVYEDARAALRGLDLDESEIAGLVAVDRRAWGHDPLRRYRTLRTLAEEFKASTTYLLAATRSLASLDDFFSSDEFHDAVQTRGSMALAFSGFLARLVDERAIRTPLVRAVVALETMLARCRRDLGRRSGDANGAAEIAVGAETIVAYGPGHEAGRFREGVVEAINAAERYLFEVGLMPAVALCDDAPRLEASEASADLLGGEPGGAVFLLALPSTSGVSLVPIDEDYYALLSQFGAGPLALGEAFSKTLAAGISREDATTMIESLLEEGVLVPAPVA